MITVRNGDREIWLADHHARYVPTMEREFAYYHGAVTAYQRWQNGDAVHVVDYSTPATHQVMGFADFSIASPSFLEPFSTAERYGDLLAVRAGEVVWDLGAYVGMATIALAKRGARVVAVEPDVQNFGCLVENVSRAQLRDVTLFPVALTGERGVVGFCADGTCGAALVRIRPQTSIVPVLGITLADLATMTGTVPDAIKLDIEGAEDAVLTSSRGFLAMHRPRLIVEPHRVDGAMNTAPVMDRLTSYGYACRLESQGLHTTPLIVAT